MGLRGNAAWRWESEPPRGTTRPLPPTTDREGVWVRGVITDGLTPGDLAIELDPRELIPGRNA